MALPPATDPIASPLSPWGLASSSPIAASTVSPAPESGGSGTLAHQFRTQALQLADHLAHRQQELDHREAELNARAAALGTNLHEASVSLRRQQVDVEALQRQWQEKLHVLEEQIGVRKSALDREYEKRLSELHACRQQWEAQARQQQLALEAEIQSRVAAGERQLSERLRAQAEEIERRSRELEAQQRAVAEESDRHRASLEETYRSRLQTFAAKERQTDQELLRRSAAVDKEIQLRVGRLEEKQRELEAREAQLAACEAESAKSRQTFQEEAASREHGVRQREQAMEAREQHLHAAIQQATARSQETVQRSLAAQEAALLETAKKLELRERKIDESGNAVAAALADAERLRSACLEERRCMEQSFESMRRQWSAQHRRELGDLEEKRRVLRRQSEEVDQGRASLLQLRDEVHRVQRETLETRLIIEELLVQVAQNVPAAARQRSLLQLRARIEEHARATQAAAAQQRAEFESIRAQLAEHQQKLAQRRQELQRWAVAKREELDSLAASLGADRDELRRRESQLRDTALRLDAERVRLGVAPAGVSAASGDSRAA
jgi:hypothetical protein